VDTSEQYIEMCRKANEIKRESSLIQLGDFICDNGQILTYTGFPVDGDFVRLPRQDQLQEMLTDLSVWNLVYTAYVFAKELKDFKVCDSMEKLWLHIVMFMQHEKKWNGQEWIREDQ
jgi:hypothetical protein